MKTMKNERNKTIDDYMKIIEDYHDCSDFVIGCDECRASQLIADSKYTTYCEFLRKHCEVIEERIMKAFKQL